MVKISKILSIGFLLLEALVLLVLAISSLNINLNNFIDNFSKVALVIIFITLNILSIIGLIKD
jgi:hypothetical protein